MTQQQQVMQSLADTFGGTASTDQILGMVAFATLFAVWIGYSIYHHIDRAHHSPFDSHH